MSMDLTTIILMYVTILMSFVLVFVLAWRGFFPRFFPKRIQKFIDSRDVPTYYDEFGNIIMVEDNSKNPPMLKNIPQPDFNMNTTATVNTSKEFDLPVFPENIKMELNPQSMDLVKTSSYCLHCKMQVEVLNPEYSDVESKRGIRRYLKGYCATCNSKINAIVKRGG